jgi:hypothetical protein
LAKNPVIEPSVEPVDPPMQSDAAPASARGAGI